MRATRAVIDLNILINNLCAVRKHIGSGTSICLSVKADAYGHGAVAAAKTAEAAGINTFGIATAEEGAELRRAGIKGSILLYGFPVPEEIPLILKMKIGTFVGDEKLIDLFAAEAEKQNTAAVVHLKVDTGMGRIGCIPEDMPVLAARISENKNLKLGGICTHFPASGSTDADFTREQIKIFKYWVNKTRESGIAAGIIHAANSDALLSIPESYMDMVRPGLLCYGYYPSGSSPGTAEKVPVKPVMDFKTKVIFIKKVKAGTPVSYGMTYRTKDETVIATLPVGYGDGYNRLLSNRGKVLIRGRLYPIAGRVCMDQCMVDLGVNNDVKLYDDVTLFGAGRNKGGVNAPDAAEIAEMTGTIPYEVTLRVSHRVPRVYVSMNKLKLSKPGGNGYADNRTCK